MVQLSRATVPLLRYAPLTWQLGSEFRLSLWTIFVNKYAWWIRDNPKLTLCSRISKLSSKNKGIFRYNLFSIKTVIPYILLACQIQRHSGVASGRHKKSVATASRTRWRHSMCQTPSVWEPVFALYCVLNFIRHWDRQSWRCWTIFHKETLGDVM